MRFVTIITIMVMITGVSAQPLPGIEVWGQVENYQGAVDNAMVVVVVPNTGYSNTTYTNADGFYDFLSVNASVDDVVIVNATKNFQVGGSSVTVVEGSNLYRADITLVLTVMLTNVALDVGNDTEKPFEFYVPGNFTGTFMTGDFSDRVNEILMKNCECGGCAIVGGDCIIPLRLGSDSPGNLTVNDLYVQYSVGKSIRNVSYGNGFRYSRGGCWEIEYETVSGRKTMNVSVPPGHDCSNPLKYTGVEHGYQETDDAINDAMYRLLNETMDADGNGVVDKITQDEYFNPESMVFNADGSIGIKSLWGPSLFKLIVWI